MIKSFAFRLTIGVMLVIVLTTIAVQIIGFRLLSAQYVREIDRWLDNETRQIGDMLQTAPPGLTPPQLSARINEKIAGDSDHALYFIQIAGARGEVFHRSPNLGETSLPPATNGSTHWTVNLPGISAHMRITEKTIAPWRVRAGLPMDSVDTIMDGYLPVSLLLISATALASLLIGYIFSRLALAPLHAIEESARHIRANNLQDRVYVPKNNRELASLAIEINRGINDVETAFAQIRRFTADASHELKTPLTLIRLNAEKLRQHMDTGAAPDAIECETHLANLLEETDVMRRVIESLLFIARADAGALTIDRAPRDIEKFIAEFAEDARLLAEDKHLHFEVTRNAPGAPAYDEPALRQLLLNLVSNAIAVTPPGGKITLESGPDDALWRLAITDEGPGLPPDALDHIFERFWRYQPAPKTPAPPASTTPDPDRPPGHGLGLAICKSIATLHAGAIHAENRPDRPGLRLIFEWPARATKGN